MVAALTTRERTFRAKVIARAGLRPGMEVLDLGCGTGTLAIAAARAEPAARLTGVDADPRVLAKARRKAAAATVSIELDEGLSTRLPYEPHSFDLVLSTLFFHHLSDADKLASAGQALRVLRPGGRLVAGDLGRPQDPLMRAASLLTVQLLDGFATTASNVAGRLGAILAAAGFEDVAIGERLRTPIGTLEVLSARRPD